METVMERECSALGGLFQTVIGDMKGSSPVWDDFISKASKLQSQLRTTVVAVAAFLDAFQKVADLATSSRGGTRDIGSALTRMCMRHRSIEAKLRQFSMVFLDCLINPLQEQMEEWKRVANTLDKDHAKDYKKARQEIKKRSSDTLKLQKKAKKGRGDLQPQLDTAMQDVSDKYLLLEETEKAAVRKALVEERSRFCCFVSMLRPVVEEEMSMLGEVTHLRTLTDDLKILTMDPHKLPASSEQVIVDLKGSECTWSYQTPPSSPSTTVSRKSSMCSSLNSVNSSDSRSSGSHCHSPTSASHFRYRASSSSSSSVALPQQTPARLSSVSSHDSGFVSQDAFQSKSPSPMPPETPQVREGDTHLHPSYSTSFSPISSPSSSSVSPAWPWPRSDYGQTTGTVPSWKDWSKPGPYDLPVVNTLKRSRDRRETTDPSSHHGADVTTPGEERTDQTLINNEREAHEELARVLARGLRLDIHGSSRDSLQGSSGYSSQTNTPCCSEDTIPSQVSDCDYYTQQSDFDKSSTIPRNSDISQSYRRMFQSKRPASTAGLPSNPSAVITPGVATIRRTPSSKPNLRRPSGGLNLGPIPIKPPMIPVKTPTVPDFYDTRLLCKGSDPPTPPPPQPGGRVSEWERRPLPELLEESEYGEVEDFLVAIRRGVKLKKTTTDDRSAPCIY
uniref:IMD domain-containing protein n=1 Tax=Scophthalmus maximus TaxID=52904 RepID=A0A8D3C1U1_SCOMX